MRDVYEKLDGGGAAPAGFRAAGVSCGIKASGKPDLALIASDRPASAAAVFTTNLGDHNRAVAQWIAWCEDHPDSGC